MFTSLGITILCSFALIFIAFIILISSEFLYYEVFLKLFLKEKQLNSIVKDFNINEYLCVIYKEEFLNIKSFKYNDFHNFYFNEWRHQADTGFLTLLKEKIKDSVGEDYNKFGNAFIKVKFILSLKEESNKNYKEVYKRLMLNKKIFDNNLKLNDFKDIVDKYFIVDFSIQNDGELLITKHPKLKKEIKDGTLLFTLNNINFIIGPNLYAGEKGYFYNEKDVCDNVLFENDINLLKIYFLINENIIEYYFIDIQKEVK